MNLLDCLLVLLKRKKLIVTVTFGATLLAMFISLLLPNIFKAESKILPPTQNQSISAQLLGQLTGVAGLNVSAAAGIKTPNDLYIRLLRSRPVLDAVIERFKLMDYYKAKYKEDARRRLLEQLSAQEDKRSGIITVGLEARNANLAADMANAVVEELKNLNRRLAITEASQRKLFYEEQLKEVKDSLTQAEESMKGFQEKTGAVKIDEQIKAVMQSIGQMRAQIAAREVQLKVMKTYSTQHNPDIQKLEEEIRGFKEQLSRLEAKGEQGADSLTPTGRMPQLGTDYLRKMRDLKFSEALYEILLKQLENAKIDEARDATVIQVLEKAEAPEKKTKPKRAQMVILGFAVGLFLAVFWAFLCEFIAKSKENPDNKERLAQIKQLATLRWKKSSF